jgi:peptidoglycan/LPS O-acetylase OafA/YrhL
LDGIRGLAILLVLVAHCLTQPLSLGQPAPGSWQIAVWRATRLCYTGVDLFFVLSGFLICKVVIENREARNLFKVFYIRRALRILPLYLLLVAGAFIAVKFIPQGNIQQWLFLHQHPLWNYLTLTQNFAMGRTGEAGGNALAVTWSLAVEEQFYLFLPLCIRFVPRGILPWLFALGFPVAYLFRMHCHDYRSYVLAVSNADALLFGCLLAWIVSKPTAMNWLREQRSGLYITGGLLLAGILYINQMPEYFGETVPTWFAAFYGILVLIAVTQRESWITRALEVRWLGFLGTISYGLYLLHRPIQTAVHAVFTSSFPKIVSARDLYLFPVSVLLSVFAATISYFLLEHFFVRQGKKFRYR